MKKTYERTCPICNKILNYGSNSAFWLAQMHNAKCRKCATSLTGDLLRNGTLSPLLQDNLISYYWLGFIFADGHLSKKGRLAVTLAIKDKEHLQKLTNFLSTSITTEDTIKVAFKIMDTKNAKILQDIYKWESNKTHYPPDLSSITNTDNLLALFIGFIDGDGCITNQTNRKDCKLTIKLHASWLPTLKLFINCLHNRADLCKINNYGYAVVSVTNSIYIKQLKQFIITNELPVLNRKWDKIDINLVSEQENSYILKENIIELRLQGLKYKEISSQLKVSDSYISRILKKYTNDNQ